jgi:glutamate--cysteine ligase
MECTVSQWIPAALKVLQDLEPGCGLPIYASMDIRDSGCKVCSVDVNLFPAGFNNLNAQEKSKAAQKMREFFSAKLLKSPPWRVCLVPEAHTNNQGYLENLTGITEILELAGAQVKLMWSGPPIPKAWPISVRNGKTLHYLPTAEALEGADVILLNHDLSGGVPAALENLPIPIYPSPKLGWYQRRKSSHFEIVDSLLSKIEKSVPGFDSWMFRPLTHSFTGLDFDRDEDVATITEELRKTLALLRKEYRARGYTQEPFVFLKNDAGTYGMGVLSFRTDEEIAQAASLIRRKLRKGKESVPVTNVIIQEGVASAFNLTEGGNVRTAEPVLYLVNGCPVGGFFRAHISGPFENLNQPGSTLESLDQKFEHPTAVSIRELLEPPGLYYFLAKLHATAAALEECPK